MIVKKKDREDWGNYVKRVIQRSLMPNWCIFGLYLGLGIVFEYVMKIPMGFYNIPIVLAFMVANFSGLFSKQGSQF